MFSIPEWDRDLITSGAYKYARQLSTENLESSLRAGRLEYYKEGAAGTVSVRRVAGRAHSPSTARWTRRMAATC